MALPPANGDALAHEDHLFQAMPGAETPGKPDMLRTRSDMGYPLRRLPIQIPV